MTTYEIEPALQRPMALQQLGTLAFSRVPLWSLGATICLTMCLSCGMAFVVWLLAGLGGVLILQQKECEKRKTSPPPTADQNESSDEEEEETSATGSGSELSDNDPTCDSTVPEENGDQNHTMPPNRSFDFCLGPVPRNEGMVAVETCCDSAHCFGTGNTDLTPDFVNPNNTSHAPELVGYTPSAAEATACNPSGGVVTRRRHRLNCAESSD